MIGKHFDSIKHISGYENDIIVKSILKSSFISYKPSIHIYFKSGRKLKIKPTHLVGLNLFYNINGKYLVNPSVEENKEILRVFMGLEQIGVQFEALLMLKNIKVLDIIYDDNVKGVIKSIKIHGIIEVNKFSKTLIYNDKIIKKSKDITIMISPRVSDLPLAFSNIKEDIGLKI